MDAETLQAMCSTMLLDGDKPESIIRSLIELGADREQAASIVRELSANDDDEGRKSKRLKEEENRPKGERRGKRMPIEDLPENVMLELFRFLPRLSSVLLFANSSPVLRERVQEFVMAEWPLSVARFVPAALGIDDPPPPADQDDFEGDASLRLYGKEGDPPACLLEARPLLYGLWMQSPATNRFARRLAQSYPLVQALELEDVVPLRRTTFEAMGAAMPSLRRVTLRETRRPPRTHMGWFESMVKRGEGPPPPADEWEDGANALHPHFFGHAPWSQLLTGWARTHAALVFDDSQADPFSAEREFEMEPPGAAYPGGRGRAPAPLADLPDAPPDDSEAPLFAFPGPLEVRAGFLRRIRLAGGPRCGDVLACLARSLPLLEEVDVAVAPHAQNRVDYEVSRLYGGVREADCVAGVLEACPQLEELDILGAAHWLPYRIFRFGDTSPRLRVLRMVLHRPAPRPRARGPAQMFGGAAMHGMPPGFAAAMANVSDDDEDGLSAPAPPPPPPQRRPKADPTKVWIQPAGAALARLGSGQADAAASAAAFAESLASCKRIEEVSFAGSSDVLGLHRALRALRAGGPAALCRLRSLDLSRAAVSPAREAEHPALRAERDRHGGTAHPQVHDEHPDLLQGFSARLGGPALRAALLVGPRLERLVLRDVGDVDVGQLRGAPDREEGLTALDLSGCRLRTQEMNWRGFSRLTELDVSTPSSAADREKRNELLDVVATYSPPLRLLAIDAARPTDPGLLPRLLERSAKTLRSLSISDVLPGDLPGAALQRFAGLAGPLESFRMLRVQNTAVDAVWLRPLLRAVGPTLHYLELGIPDFDVQGSLTDEDLRHIAACCTRLRSLRVEAMCDLTLRGLVAFLAECASLRRLTVAYLHATAHCAGGWTRPRVAELRHACGARGVEFVWAPEGKPVDEEGRELEPPQ